MTRKLKTLGVTLTAILALGSMASAAQAAEFEGTADSTVTATAIAPLTYIFNGVTIKCPTFTGTGTLVTAKSKALTLTPSYSNCALAGLPVTVNFTGCDYNLTSTNETHTECPAGAQVDFVVTEIGQVKCTITMFAGSSTGTTKYINKTNAVTKKMDVELEHSMPGLHYKEDPGKGNCGVGEGINGEYGGKITMTATNTAGGENRDLTVN